MSPIYRTRPITPTVIRHAETPALHEMMVKECENLENVYDQLRQSPLNNNLYHLEDLYFVIDGFEGNSLPSQITSRLDVFVAVRREEGLEIHRGLKFKMSPLLFFYSSFSIRREGMPVKQYTCGLKIKSREQTAGTLNSIQDRLVFKWETPGSMVFEIVEDIKVKEDLGEAVTGFPEGFRLGSNPMPERLMTAKYGIAGANHYSTTPVRDGTLCVLATEPENPYDDHAIRLFRWIPTTKGGIGKDYVHPLYKMGHIRRIDNHDLHEEMIKTGNHILFGKVENGNLSILGNLSALDKGPLGDFVLPFPLFNHIN